MRNYPTRPATKRLSKAGLLKPLKRSESCRGQTLVEFALVAMLFFTFLFALMDFSYLMFNQLNMQDAVREAARYAATGSSSGTLSRVASITQVLDQNASAANTQDCTVSISNSAGSLGPDGNPNAGGPGTNVTITAVCGIPLMTSMTGRFFAGNTFHFTVSSTFKNEPFPASQTN